MFASGLDFNTFKDSPARTKKGPQKLYCQSKLVRFFLSLQPFTDVHISSQGNIHVSNEFATRYGEQGIVSTSLNPGNIKSDLQRHVSLFEYFLIVSTPRTLITSLTNKLKFQVAILHPVSSGALTQLWAGVSPQGTEMNGKVNQLKKWSVLPIG